MSDIALEWNGYSADFAVAGNDYVIDDGLRTAVVLSLFLERRAEPGDELPESDLDSVQFDPGAIAYRGGYWGDQFPVVEGEKTGSRLWLLRRSKDIPSLLSRAETYATEALQWLVDDKVALSVDVTATFIGGNSGFVLAIVIRRPKTDPAKFRFNVTWLAEEART